MSWMPTTQPVAMASRVASSKSFSAKGSPTCTEGSLALLVAVMSSLAKVAPWMPSLPVAEPTMKTGLPMPDAVAEAVRRASGKPTMPTDIAFTSGLVW